MHLKDILQTIVLKQFDSKSELGANKLRACVQSYILIQGLTVSLLNIVTLRTSVFLSQEWHRCWTRMDVVL